MKTKVVAYCRVATHDQLAIESQKVQIQNYIKGHSDWCAGPVYADVAPASQLQEGSDLARLLEDATKGKFQRVVVPSVSRLARDMPRFAQMLHRFKEHDIAVDFLKERISTDDPNAFTLMMLKPQQH